MENSSEWYKIIERKVEEYKYIFTEEECIKYNLNLLLRISEKVDKFSCECGVCEEYKIQIAKMIGSLNNVKKLSKEQQNIYVENVEQLINHLTHEHGLDLGGERKIAFMFIGILIGAILGIVLLDRYGLLIGPPIGMLVGIVCGNSMDEKAREEGKQI
jgi:hypothetical protein